MPVYPDAQVFYQCAQEVLSRIQSEDPEATQAMVTSHLIITLRFVDPEASITVNGRWNPVRTSFGSNNTRPDLELRMAADVFHKILMGEESIKKAASTRLIKVRGPVWKLAALAPIIATGQTHYPVVLSEMGRI